MRFGDIYTVVGWGSCNKSIIKWCCLLSLCFTTSNSYCFIKKKNTKWAQFISDLDTALGVSVSDYMNCSMNHAVCVCLYLSQEGRKHPLAAGEVAFSMQLSKSHVVELRWCSYGEPSKIRKKKLNKQGYGGKKRWGEAQIWSTNTDNEETVTGNIMIQVLSNHITNGFFFVRYQCLCDKNKIIIMIPQ